MQIDLGMTRSDVVLDLDMTLTFIGMVLMCSATSFVGAWKKNSTKTSQMVVAHKHVTTFTDGFIFIYHVAGFHF